MTVQTLGKGHNMIDFIVIETDDDDDAFAVCDSQDLSDVRAYYDNADDAMCGCAFLNGDIAS